EIIDRLLDPEEIARIDSSGWGVAKLFDTIVYGEGTGFREYLTIQRASSSYDIAEFTVMLTIEHQEEVQAAIHGDTLLIRKVLYGENREFSLTANEQKLDLLPLIKDWAEIHMGKTGTVTVDQIVIPFRHGRYEGVMRLDHLNLTKQDEEVIFFFNRVDFLFR